MKPELSKKELRELKAFIQWGCKICHDRELPIYRKFEVLGYATDAGLSPSRQARLFNPTPEASHAAYWGPARYEASRVYALVGALGLLPLV